MLATINEGVGNIKKEHKVIRKERDYISIELCLFFALVLQIILPV